MKIMDWPSHERPREKLLSKGAVALSDAELLAIVLRVGIPGKSAVDLARDLLLRSGGLQGLFASSLDEFSSFKGVGQAKYVQLQAVLELARRALEEEMRSGDSLTSPHVVRRYLQCCLRSRSYEVFMGLFLDTRHRVLAVEELFRGTVNQAQVYPREVARRALQLNAAALIVAHNHPSGSTQVSASDIALTHHLQKCLTLFDVKLLDHFVIAGSTVVSLSEQGLLLS